MSGKGKPETVSLDESITSGSDYQTWTRILVLAVALQLLKTGKEELGSDPILNK